MKKQITNYELLITSLEFLFKRSFFRCALVRFLVIFAAFFMCAASLSAQNLDVLAAQIQRGDAEQKREALRIIRNAQTAEASGVAVAALRDSSEIVRATAVFSVIFLPPDEALRVLAPLLSDKKELVRRETAYALGKTRNTNAVSLLIELYRRDKVAEVKNASVVAVGAIGDAAAIDFLTGILRAKPKKENDADEFLRRAAARSIGQIAQNLQYEKTKVVTPESFSPENSTTGDAPNFLDLAERFSQFRAAIPVLLGVLQNQNETNDARRETAFALGAIGDRAAISVLQATAASEDYYLAEISRRALIEIEKIAALRNAAANPSSLQ